MPDRKRELLNELADSAGAVYLSDLHQIYYSHLIARKLKCIDANAYSLKEWTDTANYILGTHDFFSSPAQCRQHLLNVLSNFQVSKN